MSNGTKPKTRTFSLNLNTANVLTGDNKENYDKFKSFYDNSKININNIISKNESLLNNQDDLINSINSFKINNDNLINNLSQKYGNLKNLFDSSNENKNSFDELNQDYLKIIKSIADIKVNIRGIISNKNNKRSFVYAQFHTLNNDFNKLLQNSFNVIQKINEEFKDTNETLKNLFSTARYNIKKSVINYFNSKIVIQQNSFKGIQIKNENTNLVKFNNLTNMKEILLNIKTYINALKESNSKNILNKNFPTISNEQQSEINNLLTNITNDYNKIKQTLQSKIDHFKNITIQDIENLKKTISTLIIQIKDTIETFTKKDNLIKLNNLSSKINSLQSNINSSKELNQKLQEILNNLTNGLNNSGTGSNPSVNESNNTQEHLPNNNINTGKPVNGIANQTAVEIGNPVKGIANQTAVEIENPTANKKIPVNGVLNNNANLKYKNKPLVKLFNQSNQSNQSKQVNK